MFHHLYFHCIKLFTVINKNSFAFVSDALNSFMRQLCALLQCKQGLLYYSKQYANYGEDVCSTYIETLCNIRQPRNKHNYVNYAVSTNQFQDDIKLG